jgi:hypothetical protein
MDVDAVSDGEQVVVIGAIMQHIEQAGVHSGDSACSLPPYNLPMDVQDAFASKSLCWRWSWGHRPDEHAVCRIRMVKSTSLK